MNSTHAPGSTRTRAPEPRLLGYARTSARSPDPTYQIDALTAAGCRLIWIDSATVPGPQPQLAELRDQAVRGDILVTWRLDRLAGNFPALAILILDLHHHHLHIRSIEEALDSTTTGGAYLFPLMEALVEFQQELRREQSQLGLIAAHASGRGGRPPVVTSQMRQTALNMNSHGATPTTISTALNVSRATIYRLLANPSQHPIRKPPQQPKADGRNTAT